ncbi:MAG TPA: HPP family protein [Ferruginibacter sp.]|nr:HPP family protein [Ferruginibacter sp.]
MKKKIKRTIRVSRYVIYKETLVDYKEHLWAFLGSFFGIGLIALFHTSLSTNGTLFLIGSFGASSVLVYGIIQSPLAQPRNLVGGHLVCAITGVTVHKFLPDLVLLAAPLAVSLSIVFMQITKTLHPPGGATALIAIIGSDKIKALGYWYVLSPVFTGAMILLLVAIIFNNMTTNRIYPTNERYTKYVSKIFSRMKRQPELKSLK